MRKLNSHVIFFVFALLVGVLVVFFLEGSFKDAIFNELTTLTYRYILLVFILCLGGYTFGFLHKTHIMIRYHSFFDFYLFIIRKEILYFTVFAFLFFLPMFLLKNYLILENILYIVFLFLHFVVISTLFMSIIHLLDSFFKKISLSITVFLIFYAAIDIMMEVSGNIITVFSLNHLFVYPLLMTPLYYIFFSVTLILFAWVINMLAFQNMIRSDYLLRKSETYV